MHNKQVMDGIGYYKENSEAPWLLTKCRFTAQNIVNQ